MENAIWLNDFFRLALEGSPSGQLIVDSAGLIRHVNSKISTMFGYDKSELVGRSLEILVPDEFRAAHPEYRNRFFDKPVVRTMGTGQVLFGLHKSGTRIPVEIGLNPLADLDDKYVLASVVDISERLTAERRFELALEATPNGVILMNESGNIILVNSKVEEIFGYSREEMNDQSVGMLVPMNYRKQHPDVIANFLKSPSSRAMGTGRDLFGLRKDGTEVPLEIGLNPLDIDGKTHVLASVVDISERKQAEAEKQSLNNQIQHAQRLESLGVLAGGTAHDFNNILSAISGNAELVIMSLPEQLTDRDKIVTYLENIVRSCKRASGLTTQMLAYAGKGKMIFEKIDINALIDDMRDLIGSTLSKRINLVTSLCANMPPIKADRSQIQQVILNLITNASEAIGDHDGSITLTTGVEYKNLPSLEKYKYFDYLGEGDYLFIDVKDDGVGMEQEVIDSMFDPFFTTKFTGRGLGMAAVLGIIRSHFGSVHVDSAPSRGARIKIIFPVSGDTTAEERLSDANTGKSPARKRVLVIDDEADVREILAEMMGHSDFDVSLARTGDEGLAMINQAAQGFDMIVLDMNMPGKSGAEVYAELSQSGHSYNILLISGYSEQKVSSLISSDPGNSGKAMPTAFIQKPFTFSQLTNALKTLF